MSQRHVSLDLAHCDLIPSRPFATLIVDIGDDHAGALLSNVPPSSRDRSAGATCNDRDLAPVLFIVASERSTFVLVTECSEGFPAPSNGRATRAAFRSP